MTVQKPGSRGGSTTRGPRRRGRDTSRKPRGSLLALKRPTASGSFQESRFRDFFPLTETPPGTSDFTRSRGVSSLGESSSAAIATVVAASYSPSKNLLITSVKRGLAPVLRRADCCPAPLPFFRLCRIMCDVAKATERKTHE